jgi:hypothetical protein
LEYGHWVVTSDKREAAFYACVDNAPKMTASEETAINAGDGAVAERWLARNIGSQTKCQAKLTNPKVVR